MEWTEVVRGVNEFVVNEITHIGWYRFMQEVAGNENNFELCALFDLALMK